MGRGTWGDIVSVVSVVGMNGWIDAGFHIHNIDSVAEFAMAYNGDTEVKDSNCDCKVETLG